VPVKTLPVLRSKNVGCFNPNLGIIWTNPNVGLNIKKKKSQLKVKVEIGLKF